MSHIRIPYTVKSRNIVGFPCARKVILIARQAKSEVCFEVIHISSVKCLFFLEFEDVWKFESNIHSTSMILRV